MVFDEVHWGKFVSAYCCTHERVFDVHPPHGKLLLTVGAVLGGYGGAQSFESIGLPYDNHPVFFLRLIPALCGIAIPMLFFYLLRGAGGSLAIAWIGGVLLALDNALILETRTMLFDGVLLAASLGAFVCLWAIERASSSARAWGWTLGCGMLAGLAVGTKFTGLAVPALAGLWLAHRWWTSRASPARGLILGQGLVMAIAGVAVYLAGWFIHFSLLTQPGPADAFHPTTGRFFEDLRVAHRTMIDANANMVATHPDASHPLTWPIMTVPPYFWSGDQGAVEYLIGNPVVWWGSSVVLLVLLVQFGLSLAGQVKPLARPARSRLWWLLTAYALSYLPFFRVTRILFLYHYFTPLILALACGLIWLDQIGWTRSEGGRQRLSYYGVMAAAVVGFLLMSPMTYGYSAGSYGNWLVGVIRSWR